MKSFLLLIIKHYLQLIIKNYNFKSVVFPDISYLLLFKRFPLEASNTALSLKAVKFGMYGPVASKCAQFQEPFGAHTSQW